MFCILIQNLPAYLFIWTYIPTHLPRTTCMRAIKIFYYFQQMEVLVQESVSCTSVATSIWSVESDFNPTTVIPSSHTISYIDDATDLSMLPTDAKDEHPGLSVDAALDSCLDGAWCLDSAWSLEESLEISLDDSLDDSWDCCSLDEFVQLEEQSFADVVVGQAVEDSVGTFFDQMYCSKLTLDIGSVIIF